MRHDKECRTIYLDYRLRAWVDGVLRVERAVAPRGARGDRPLYVAEDLRLAPGPHRVRVEFVPREDPRGDALRLHFDATVAIERGRARLLAFDDETRMLRLAP
jgi:hypothetical protein